MNKPRLEDSCVSCPQGLAHAGRGLAAQSQAEVEAHADHLIPFRWRIRPGCRVVTSCRHRGVRGSALASISRSSHKMPCARSMGSLSSSLRESRPEARWAGPSLRLAIGSSATPCLARPCTSVYAINQAAQPCFQAARRSTCHRPVCATVEACTSHGFERTRVLCQRQV